MAKLTSAIASLEMMVLGYGFTRDDDPDDWLNLRLVATRRDERWDLVDACLTTSEIRDLCRWLSAVAAGDYSRPAFWSTDDQPEFHLTDDRSSLSVTLGVWKLHLADGIDWIELEFPNDAESIGRFASELTSEAERFPIRN